MALDLEGYIGIICILFGIFALAFAFVLLIMGHTAWWSWVIMVVGLIFVLLGIILFVYDKHKHMKKKELELTNNINNKNKNKINNDSITDNIGGVSSNDDKSTTIIM